MKKQLLNECILRFPSRSINEAFARSTAAAFIAQLDPNLEQLYDIKTAVSEAVTNAIVHGYRDQVGTITMTVRLYAPSWAEIIIKDRGCGIPDVGKDREPMFTTGGSERRGIGFTIMESFMDHLSVRSTPGKGTTVKMRKLLDLRPEK